MRVRQYDKLTEGVENESPKIREGTTHIGRAKQQLQLSKVSVKALIERNKLPAKLKALLRQLESLAGNSTISREQRNLAWRAAGRLRKPPPMFEPLVYVGNLHGLEDQALLAALAELNLP